MKQRKRAASPEELATLTGNRQETSYPHVKPDRLKKQQKTIQMNRNSTFYFDESRVFGLRNNPRLQAAFLYGGKL